MAILPKSFFARDVLEVAPDLLGKELRRDDVILRITEVEAYRWPGDTACHARSGRTQRNASLWGEPGRAYVYLCYGLHNMLNLVTGPDGHAQAVLIRACTPVSGLDTILQRRGMTTSGRGPRADEPRPVLLTGPGKIGQALALDTSWSHHPLYRSGGLTLHDGPSPPCIRVGPRVGIDYATAAHRRLPWRYAAADTPWVTHPRSLRRKR